MSATELDLILSELNYYGGKVHLGVPEATTQLSPHDLILLLKWTPEDLLKIARTQACQVAIDSAKVIPEVFSPFYDWRIFDKGSCDQLKKLSEGQTFPSHSPSSHTKSALFLDRDGVVNVDHGYVGDPLKVNLVPHIGELIHQANDQHKDVVIVTNQSGIGRGYYTTENYQQVMKRISELLRPEQAKVDEVLFSPFHPNANEEEFRRGRQFRKPRPGMLQKAARDRGIHLRQSVMVGDHAKDAVTAVLAGVGQVFLLASAESEEAQDTFQTWVEELKFRHHLHLMDSIKFKVVGGLQEAKL